MPWVYVVECADGSYYVGSTGDLGKVARNLDLGLGPAYVRASTRRPARIVWSEALESPSEVTRRKRQLKGWSRERKRALAQVRQR